MNVFEFFGGLLISIGAFIGLLFGGCALVLLWASIDLVTPDLFSLAIFVALVLLVTGCFVGPGIFLWKKGIQVRAGEKEEATRKYKNVQQ